MEHVVRHDGVERLAAHARRARPLAVEEHVFISVVRAVLEARRVVREVARAELVAVRQHDEARIAREELGHVGWPMASSACGSPGTR